MVISLFKFISLISIKVRQLSRLYYKVLFVRNVVKKQQNVAHNANLCGIVHANAKKKIGKSIKLCVKKYLLNRKQ